MFEKVSGVSVSGYGWRDGVYYYEVSAMFDGKRETLKLCPSLEIAISFHEKANAFLQGEYDSEVFDAFNAIKQQRMES